MTPTPHLTALYAEQVRVQAIEELDSGERTLLEFNSIELAIAGTLRQADQQMRAMVADEAIKAKGKRK